MVDQVRQYLTDLEDRFHQIPNERKVVLDQIAQLVSNELKQKASTELVFICTHNSRRSQFGQIWAATAAAYFGLDGVNCFSGGTEETAFHPNAVAAVKRCGFKVEHNAASNPKYELHSDLNSEPIVCFSKVYDHSSNPQKGFIALMTCNDADENCPVVIGASARFKLTYNDPKISDGTPEQEAVYDERCKQIATEMLYLFSKVKA